MPLALMGQRCLLWRCPVQRCLWLRGPLPVTQLLAVLSGPAGLVLAVLSGRAGLVLAVLSGPAGLVLAVLSGPAVQVLAVLSGPAGLVLAVLSGPAGLVLAVLSGPEGLVLSVLSGPVGLVAVASWPAGQVLAVDSTVLLFPDLLTFLWPFPTLEGVPADSTLPPVCGGAALVAGVFPLSCRALANF
ncbi:hypothetical protein NDU88_000345 [Pleurodeles waltl]|uniref:Uncharacterized protein n=1 Tax=Pleurodeles waltl TaxID=8319 RepID=A0AAV7U788_PLEWA|nr:hypothetical protein NDU88_000345 [Pleurodeles waltl]